MTPDERVRNEERALLARQGDAAGWARLSRDHERLGRLDDAARAALFAYRVAPTDAEHLARLQELGWADGLWPSERGDAQNRQVSPLEGPDAGVLRWRATLPRAAAGRPVIDLQGRVLTRALHEGLLRVTSDAQPVEELKALWSRPPVLVGGEPTAYDGRLGLTDAPIARYLVSRGRAGWSYAHGALGLVALAPDGEIRWRLEPRLAVHDVAVTEAHVLAIVGSGLALWPQALDATSGAPGWKGPQHVRGASAAHHAWVVGADDGAWVCGLQGEVVCHDAGGRERWRRKLGASIDPPATAGTRVVLTTGLHVEELELTTGALRWRRELRAGRSPVIDGRGIIYVSTSDHRVIGLRPDGTTHCQATVKGSQALSAPSIGWDRTAYVTVGKTLVAIR